jgi:hypothetical protein
MKKIQRLGAPPKDIRNAAVDMSVREARFMIEDFYRWVGLAQASKDHRRILDKEDLTNYSVGFMSKQVRNMRDQYRLFLDIWSEQYPAAKWAKSIRGIGPVIAAGLAAYIDIDKAKSISSIWRYAGVDPNSRRMTLVETDALIQDAMDKFGTEISDKHVIWISGRIGKDPEKLLAFSRSKKRGLTWPKLSRAIRWPSYNPMVKRIVISAGNCFIKHPSMYHDLYTMRKIYETNINENGGYKKRAKRQFERYNYQPGTGAYDCYSQGRLPESHIIGSAKRYAVKIFLAHYFMVDWYIKYDEAPPDCYALDILKGHRKIHIPGSY